MVISLFEWDTMQWYFWNWTKVLNILSLTQTAHLWRIKPILLSISPRQADRQTDFHFNIWISKPFGKIWSLPLKTQSNFLRDLLLGKCWCHSQQEQFSFVIEHCTATLLLLLLWSVRFYSNSAVRFPCSAMQFSIKMTFHHNVNCILRDDFKIEWNFRLIFKGSIQIQICCHNVIRKVQYFSLYLFLAELGHDC